MDNVPGRDLGYRFTCFAGPAKSPLNEKTLFQISCGSASQFAGPNHISIDLPSVGPDSETVHAKPLIASSMSLIARIWTPWWVSLVDLGEPLGRVATANRLLAGEMIYLPNQYGISQSNVVVGWNCEHVIEGLGIILTRDQNIDSAQSIAMLEDALMKRDPT
jgi:hypothetical protein